MLGRGQCTVKESPKRLQKWGKVAWAALGGYVEDSDEESEVHTHPRNSMSLLDPCSKLRRAPCDVRSVHVEVIESIASGVVRRIAGATGVVGHPYRWLAWAATVASSRA